MYSNLESDEGKRREVISALYWSLMQNWNIPQSIQDYYGFSEDYRLYHQPPAEYLDKLNEDLQKLGQIAAMPDAVHDILHISPAFLVRYGIDKKDSPEECSRQAEKAYRELDARFVRMTGRRPYADELFASLKRKTEDVAKENRPKQSHRTILRNPLSKGRKMGL